MKTKKQLVFFILFLCTYAHASEQQLGDSSYQQVDDPGLTVVPIPPAPGQQVMQDNDDFESDGVDENRWNPGSLALRIAAAKKRIAPDAGLFRLGCSSRSERCANMSEFATCYALKCCEDPREESPQNSSLDYISCDCDCEPLREILGCAIITAFEVPAKVIESPVAASYVCCNAECARKCYRSRYERGVLFKLGVRKK